MQNQHTVNVLNHLLAIHHRSLPVYLRSAPPWTRRRGDTAVEALGRIAAAQSALVDRIGAMIIELDGAVRYGEYPMVFAEWHDLTVGFLLSRAVDGQLHDILNIEKCAGWLEDAPRARALAEEALGEAKGHLETLQELAEDAAA